MFYLSVLFSQSLSIEVITVLKIILVPIVIIMLINNYYSKDGLFDNATCIYK